MTSVRSVSSLEKSQNSSVCPRMCRISMRNISRSLKALSVARHGALSEGGCGPSWTDLKSAPSSACSCSADLAVASASTSRTTGNRLACCMRKKSSHRKSLIPSSRARALSTSGRSSEASSSGQSERWNSWLMNSRKCSSADSGLGECGSRWVKCLISTVAARNSRCLSGDVIL